MSATTSTSVRKLELLARVELMRLKLAGRIVRTQASLIALAVLLGVGGIGMLMLCLYTILADAYGHVAGALSTGMVLLVLAWIIHLWAGRVDGGGEGRSLNELEAIILSDIKSDVARVENNIRRLESGVMSVLSGSFLRNFMGGERRKKSAASKEAASEDTAPKET